MKNKDDCFEILAIGLDSLSIEIIKNCLTENGLNYRISFLNDVNELDAYQKKNAEAVFFFSNRQSPKTIQDIRKIKIDLPRAAITLISTRADYLGIVGAFRAGLFDFLTLPVDVDEIRTIIYRLQLHEVIQSGNWNPERAVLHLFSRPESFSSIKDIVASLNQYLGLFFRIEKHVIYSSEQEMIQEVKSFFNINQHQYKRIRRFLDDPSGLIFGLRFIRDKFHFLVKGEGQNLSYIVATNSSDFSIKEIQLAIESSFIPVSLGNTRLRTETAAIVACHSVVFRNEDF
jgi:DNA-binding NarL/FixJ family response regulator